MISKKAKYALKALIFLGKNEDEAPISVRRISESEGISLKFLEAIFRELSKAKFLKSERGSNGGYSFRMRPEEIKILEVMRVIDGPVAMLPCVSEKFYERCEECQEEEPCQIRKLFLEVRIATVSILSKSLAEVMNDEGMEETENA